MKISKAALFTDIHFGRKQNSEVHNQDCIDFINFMVNDVDLSSIDSFIFLGDLFETRQSLDQRTIDYVLKGLSILNDTGLPSYLIVGNHDMYAKESREIFATKSFQHMQNIHIIDSITKIGDCVLFPYLLKEDYLELPKYKNEKIWLGHFSINEFYITGYHDVKMIHGDDAKLFAGPDLVLSGHFHKRQKSGNIHYIGSPFGYDFSDVFDFDKGYSILNVEDASIEYFKYKKGPKFARFELNQLLKVIDSDKKLPSKLSLEITINEELSYEEFQSVEAKIKDNIDLRSLKFKESTDIISNIVADDDMIENIDYNDVNDFIITCLRNVSDESIDTKKLCKLYEVLEN